MYIDKNEDKLSIWIPTVGGVFKPSISSNKKKF